MGGLLIEEESEREGCLQEEEEVDQSCDCS